MTNRANQNWPAETFYEIPTFHGDPLSRIERTIDEIEFLVNRYMPVEVSPAEVVTLADEMDEAQPDSIFADMAALKYALDKVAR